MSTSTSVLSRIRELFGLTRAEVDTESSAPSLELLLQTIRRQLLEGARYLGLTAARRPTEEAPARPEPADRPPKFDLGRPTAKMVEVEHIPWAYGQDRVTAAVVDPQRLYVYWEATDEAMERARAQLGAGGRDAWLNLRVYDVTNRIFDGTNAHSYFDHAVSRTDRQWFFAIGKPASTAIVELGLKSHEGYFVRIARSGRTDFPRQEPASPGHVEWLTVRAATGEIGTPAADMHPPAAVPPGTGLPMQVEPVRVWDIRRTHGAGNGEWIIRDEAFGAESMSGHRIEWEGGLTGMSWEGPRSRISWEAGPFPYPVEPPPYVEERHGGTVSARIVDGRTHIVYGPWRVVIRGLGARAERTILGIWEISRSWVAHAGAAVEMATRSGRVLGASEQMVLGASERLWRAASELRLGGASEIHRLGASELRYLGASETLYSGASEWRFRGASELRFLGASEWRYAGASEMQHAGASERPFAGASERAHLGASEGRQADASGGWLGYPDDTEPTSAERG